MCPSGAICLPTECCFSELALYKSNSACWSTTKRTSSLSHISPPLFFFIRFWLILPFSVQNFLHKSILPPLLAASDFDWYYHFQCRTFYTKVYYLPFYLYYIMQWFSDCVFGAGYQPQSQCEKGCYSPIAWW